MFKYAVAEIAGRQYKIEPGQLVQVNYLGDIKTFDCDKVLMVVDDDKVELGVPFLNIKLKFDVLGTFKGPKIRVATYKPKANTRKVKGSKSLYSKIQLSTKNREKS